MLRMRKKPPEGLPTLNAGKPWSEDDLADLKDMVRQCHSPREIAEYLQREVLEVEARSLSGLDEADPPPQPADVWGCAFALHNRKAPAAACSGPNNTTARLSPA